MEDALAHIKPIKSHTKKSVLILVVMEDALALRGVNVVSLEFYES